MQFWRETCKAHAMCADSKIGVGSTIVLFECLVGEGGYNLFVFLVPAQDVTKIQ